MRTTLTAGLAALILTFAGRQECRAQRVVVEELRPRRRTLPKGRLDFTPPVPVHVRLPDGMRPPRRPGARPLRPRRRRGRASRRNRAWVPVLSAESFEASGFPPTSWSTWDSVTDNGEHHWGRTDYTAQDGTHSAWCAGGGADALDPATDNYPDQATSWLQYGPFSLPAGQRAVAQFAYWNETEAEFDYFYWLIYAPDIDPGGYWGYGVSGATGGWHVVDFDLNNVIGLGDLAGQTELYLAFYFHTDDGVTFKGTFLDYVSIQTTEDPAPSPTWTVMLYLDGDNAQELDAIEDFRELAPMAANPDVRFVSLMDRAAGYAGDDPDNFYYDDWTTTRRYVLKQDTDLWTRPTPPRDYEDLGELNMGDPQTLTDFVTWAQTNHPATYYALVIWGNGTGWGPAPPKGPTAEGGLKQRDVLYDEDADDYLTTGELRQALTGLGDRIDVVAFDADLMGSIEVVYELATVTDHVVASEDVRPIVPLSPERPLDFPYHTMFSPSVINATTTPQQLCGGLVAAYSAYYDLLDLGGLAAWQTAGVTDASTALSAFADALLLGLSSERPAIDASRAAAQRFDGTVDLHDFAAEVFANSADPGIQSAAQGLMAAIVASSFMTAEWHDAEHYGANAADMRGLAGYLPLNATDPAYAAYNGTTLKFLANPAQMWDDFLAAYLMPQAPSGLSASDRPADNGDAVELSWTRSPDDGAGGRDDVTEYRVYRIVGGSATKGGRAAVATVSADDSETYNYTDDGLTPGQEYCYTVRAYNGLESADSNEECVSPTDETPPGAPQNLVAADRADDQGGAIDLSWDRSDDDGQGAGDAIEYHVIRDGTQVHVVAATGAASYEWTDTDRTDGQEYCYKIRAFDGTSESGDSNESCAASLDNTAPGAPTNVAASDVADDQGGAVDLSWDRSADDGQGAGDVVEYRILRDGGQVDVVVATGAASYNWRDAGLTNGQEYCYIVRAFDATNESTDSNEDCATPVDNLAPGVPENLAAADTPADGGGSITLTWDRSPDDGIGGDDVTEYHIFRRQNGGAATKQAAQIGVLPATDSEGYQFEDADATIGVEYCYTVRAYDDTQESPDSNESCATSQINVPAAPPENLVAVDTPDDQGGSITLTWDASPDDGGGNDSVTEYWVYRKQATTVFVKIAAVAATDQAGYTYVDDAAQTGVEYTYKATTWNQVDESSGPTASATAVDNLAPGPPQDLVVTNPPGFPGDRLDVTFDPSPDEVGGAGDVIEYRLYRDGGLIQSFVPDGSPQYAYQDTGLTTGQEYCYTIAAWDGTNESAAGPECATPVTGAIPGDLNDDGDVDVDDLTLFRAAWGGTAGAATKQCQVYSEDADLDGDGDVDRADFWRMWYNNAPHHADWVLGDTTGTAAAPGCPLGYPGAAPDDFLDFWDLIAFAGHWGTQQGDPGWDEAFDFAGPVGSAPAGPDKPCPVDGKVDFYDLIAFAGAWGAGAGPASVGKSSAVLPAEWVRLARELEAARGDSNRTFRLLREAVESGRLRR